MAEDNDDDPDDGSGTHKSRGAARGGHSVEGGATETSGDCPPLLSCEARKRLECIVRADTAAWCAPAFSSYAYLRSELERLASSSDTARGAVVGPERALDEALLAMADADRWCKRRRTRFPRRPRPWIALKCFYSGSDIEHTWRAIHRAQAAAYTIYPADELLPQAEHVEAVVVELSDQTSLLKSVTTLTAKLAAAGPSPVTGSGKMLRGIYERAIDVSDNLQREARGLRNALLIASAASLFVLVALGVAHVFDKDVVELCTGASKKFCPIDHSAHSLDVFTVEFAGMLGGLLSIVIPLASGEQIKTPYRVFNQQLLLKMLVGAATALGGILLIESGVITTIKLDSTTTILGYAVFLGFAQQVATGAIDRRADALAKQTPIAKSV